MALLFPREKTFFSKGPRREHGPGTPTYKAGLLLSGHWIKQGQYLHYAMFNMNVSFSKASVTDYVMNAAKVISSQNTHTKNLFICTLFTKHHVINNNHIQTQ